MEKANEGHQLWNHDEMVKDRKLFVHNLGWLLSQTREQILSCELDDDEIVTVTYVGGGTRKINIYMDSYMAIVKDVSKHA